LAMYQPLHRLDICGALSELNQSSMSTSFAKLIQLVVREPQEEALLRSRIEPLSPIDNTVSDAVRGQYEQHPYPRWFDLTEKSRISYYDYLNSLFPHFAPSEALREPVSVLSAGCGTGQEAAIIASGRLTEEVTGLDLSATSLAYAQRMATKKSLSNVKFVQGDILNLNELGQTFPVIESTGVLHHMADPVAGWQSLVNVLREPGMMKVGLYSTRASKEVEKARAWIKAQGYPSDDETIKEVRAKILSADQDHPLYALRHSEDFYSVSACRDLIFHVQECTYTPAELSPILKQLGLNFIGFELPTEQIRADYLAQFPEDRSMTNLESWDQFDQKYPDTFSGMLVFWCQLEPRG
nr:class I SAM-dependent methyltransferase [Granulosicoccus sp.]